jgi:hypothetical protein
MIPMMMQLLDNIDFIGFKYYVSTGDQLATDVKSDEYMYIPVQCFLREEFNRKCLENMI